MTNWSNVSFGLSVGRRRRSAGPRRRLGRGLRGDDLDACAGPEHGLGAGRRAARPKRLGDPVRTSSGTSRTSVSPSSSRRPMRLEPDVPRRIAHRPAHLRADAGPGGAGRALNEAGGAASRRGRGWSGELERAGAARSGEHSKAPRRRGGSRRARNARSAESVVRALWTAVGRAVRARVYPALAEHEAARCCADRPLRSPRT